MLRIGRRLELVFLPAAQPKFFAQPFYSMNAELHAVLSQVFLQAFGPKTLTRALVGGEHFGLKT